MTTFLSLCFLFFVGSCLGWCIEVVFRRFVSAKKWINPGFLTGPYLPIYGFGLVGLYSVCAIPVQTGSGWGDALVTILIMGVIMTAIEYVAGLIFIKGMKIKLWDYSNQPGNVQGDVSRALFNHLEFRIDCRLWQRLSASLAMNWFHRFTYYDRWMDFPEDSRKQISF